ncbi:CTP synthase [Planctomycetota bacterium]
MPNLIILGEFTPTFEPHAATNRAIEHSCKKYRLGVEYEWLSTDDIREDLFEHAHGLWVAPGSPYKNIEKTLWAIRYAREHGIPVLGTCGGFQHMIIELARNILGFEDAQHAEYDPYASKLFVSELECSLAGREMLLRLEPESHVAGVYGTTETKEMYYCNFGVNPEYVNLVKSGPLKAVGSDVEGDVRIIEHPDHPFYIGTLFVPQTLSTEDKPHVLVTAFLQAIVETRSRQSGC